MSLKDQAGFVKEVLSGDEKILESAFKLEQLYKKHKLKIWSLLILLVLFFAGRAGMQAYQEANLYDANSALLVLQENPSDSVALSTLKEKNPKLYELFSYMNAVKNKEGSKLSSLGSSSDALIADISKYHAAVIESKVVDSTYYLELSLVQEAYEALRGGKKDLAKQKLALVPENSAVSGIARLLRHYTIEVK
ncbi:MAG: hypothetical protein HF962_01710 [Sulfurovum sp.]|nr:hypothetical protein [Sulfurovum sp.]